MFKKYEVDQSLVEILQHAVKDGDAFYADKKNLTELQKIINELNCRIPKKVIEFTVYHQYSNNCYTIEHCPNCGVGITYTYQHYCSDCGQKLEWISFKKMKRKVIE